MQSSPRITASTRARPPLDPVQTDAPFEFIHVNKCGGSSIEVALGLPKTHDTAVERREEIGQAAWDAAFTFATVRNPFDRVASIYYYRLRTDQDGLADRHLSFNAWVRRVFADHEPPYWEDTPLLGPATDWLCENGVLIVDRVVPLERIADQWPAICRVLGVTRHLQILNNNSHPAHGAIYDPGARRIVEEVFASDLETFGYTFQPA